MGNVYDVDVLEWSEHQARLLRQHSAGEAGNEAPDWINMAMRGPAFPCRCG